MENKNKEETVELDHNVKFYKVVGQGFATLFGSGLFIADKFLGLNAEPIDPMIYFMLAGVAMGNDSAMNMIGLGHKK